MDLRHDIQAVLRCSFFPFSFYRHGIVLNQTRLCSAIMDLEPQIMFSTSSDYYSKYSSTIRLFTRSGREWLFWGAGFFPASWSFFNIKNSLGGLKGARPSGGGEPLLFWLCGRAVCNPGRVRPGDFGGWCSRLPCLAFNVLGVGVEVGGRVCLLCPWAGRLVVLPLPVGGWTGGGGLARGPRGSLRSLLVGVP